MVDKLAIAYLLTYCAWSDEQLRYSYFCGISTFHVGYHLANEGDNER